jgi:hypothetical protein
MSLAAQMISGFLCKKKGKKKKKNGCRINLLRPAAMLLLFETGKKYSSATSS